MAVFNMIASGGGGGGGIEGFEVIETHTMSVSYNTFRYSSLKVGDVIKLESTREYGFYVVSALGSSGGKGGVFLKTNNSFRSDSSRCDIESTTRTIGWPNYTFLATTTATIYRRS